MLQLTKGTESGPRILESIWAVTDEAPPMIKGTGCLPDEGIKTCVIELMVYCMKNTVCSFLKYSSAFIMQSSFKWTEFHLGKKQATGTVTSTFSVFFSIAIRIVQRSCQITSGAVSSNHRQC